MKIVKTSMLILMVFQIPLTPIMSQIELQWENGALFQLHHVDVMKEDIAAWQEHVHPLKQLFYDYNHPASVTAYKQLFYQNGFPSIIDQVYDEWQMKMKGVRTEIQGIFYGQLDSLDIACIQYAYTQSGYELQMSFLAYRIEGHWYPLEAASNVIYQPVIGFMAVLQPDLAYGMLHPTPTDQIKTVLQEMKTRCQATGTLLTTKCIQHIAEEWGISDDPSLQNLEAHVFKSRYQRDVSTADLQNMTKNLEDYLTTLQLPEEGLKRAKYYFSKNEVMQAITVMESYGLDIETSVLFENLNRIQHTGQYKTIDHTSLNTVKSN